MVLLALIGFHSDPEAHPLSVVKFWQDELIRQDPDFARNWAYWDRTEGTAQYYAEATDHLLGQTPVNRSIREEDLTEADLAEFLVNDPDNVAYAVGKLACYALVGRVPHWQAEIEAGQDPLSLLLESIMENPGRPPDSPVLHDAIQKSADASQTAYSQVFEPFLSHFGDPAFVEINIPFSMIAGSFMISGNWNITEKDGTRHSVMLDYQGEFRDTEWKFALNSPGTVVEEIETDMPYPYVRFFLPSTGEPAPLALFEGVKHRKEILPSGQTRVTVGAD